MYLILTSLKLIQYQADTRYPRVTQNKHIVKRKISNTKKNFITCKEWPLTGASSLDRSNSLRQI